MGGIADRHQSATVPAGEAVELYRQKVEIGDLVEFAEIEVGERGSLDFLANGIDPACLIFGCRSLGDQKSALPIGVAVDQDEQATALHVAAQSALAAFLGHSEPEYVHRRAEIFEGEDLSGQRRAAVRGNRQRSA